VSADAGIDQPQQRDGDVAHNGRHGNAQDVAVRSVHIQGAKLRLSERNAKRKALFSFRIPERE